MYLTKTCTECLRHELPTELSVAVQHDISLNMDLGHAKTILEAGKGHQSRSKTHPYDIS